MSHSVPLLLVALLVTAGASPALSQIDPDPDRTYVKIHVPIGDLDLTTASGADTLIQRVAHMAAEACTGKPAVGALMLQELRAYRACKDAILTQAVAQLGSPRVAQRYAERHGARSVNIAEARP